MLYAQAVRAPQRASAYHTWHHTTFLVKKISTSDEECNYERYPRGPSWEESGPARVTSSAGQTEKAFSFPFPVEKDKALP